MLCQEPGTLHMQVLALSSAVCPVMLCHAVLSRDYYNETGHLQPTAALAEKLLLAALALNPGHTHALHLHIHITEAGTPPGEPSSGQPNAPIPPNSAGRGLSSATALIAAAPRNGHLLHMPSHTYFRVGQYKRAVEVNKAAYQFDLDRGAQCVVPYLPEHNVHMLITAARSGEQSKRCLRDCSYSSGQLLLQPG